MTTKTCPGCGADVAQNQNHSLGCTYAHSRQTNSPCSIIYVSAGYDELMRHFGDEKLADRCYRETIDATIDDEVMTEYQMK